MKKSFFSFFFLLSFVNVILADGDFVKEGHTSIESFMNQHKLSIEVTGTGGHVEECVNFEIKNLTGQKLEILIESGRRLTTKDSTVQDILIVKEQLIVLESHQSINIKGNGYCCQSSKSSPSVDTVFGIGKMAKAGLLELANVINKNNFPSGAIQSAVWAISDDHEVSSIYHVDLNSIKLLRETVARIKGEKLPWYTTKYKKETDELFSHSPTEIVGTFDYFIKNNSSISVAIKQKNRLILPLMANEAIGAGHHEFVFNLRVEGWQKGEYTIILIDDAAGLIEKKDFTIR